MRGRVIEGGRRPRIGHRAAQRREIGGKRVAASPLRQSARSPANPAAPGGASTTGSAAAPPRGSRHGRSQQ